MVLDTTFLIDLEREALGTAKDNSATTFLKNHSKEELWVSIVTVGEFAEGFGEEKKELFDSYLSRFPVLPVDREVAWLYGKWARQLRIKGQQIGGNDLWIAVSALRHNQKLVTRNVREFKRVLGELVVGY